MRPPLFTFKSQCQRKVRYRTKREAQEAAERLRMRVYKCEWCGGRHLTSNLGGRKDG